MKFKPTKIATAVAVGLGVSVVSLNVARADEILFPYFANSDTVTSIATVINTRPTSSTQNGLRLHYRFYYKEGANAESLSAPCVEGDQRRVTSRNDIVTFDLSGKFGDALGVLFEPASKQILANYTADNRSFAFMKSAAKPNRGFMTVDNNEGGPTNPFGSSLFGELILMDFVEGAVWGYQAYNSNYAPASSFNFSDGVESSGEVIAGPRWYVDATAANNLGNGYSRPIPVGIMPIAGPGLNADGVFTKFFVTPINTGIRVGNTFLPAISNISGRVGQQATALATRIGLTVYPYTGSAGDTAFDRDEVQVSSSLQKDVVCVGAVNVQDFFSSIVAQDIAAYGGWGAIRIAKPGPLVAGGARTLNTNEAVVIKLEYNPSGKFISSTFKGGFNNALWLRSGHRESLNFFPVGNINVPFDDGVVIVPRFVQWSAENAETGESDDLGSYEDLAGTVPSVSE